MDTYSVLSEFKFETAEAVAKSEALKNTLDKVAASAEAVHDGLISATYGLLGQIGLYGGIAGALWSVVKASDKYASSQRSIANIFLANGMFKGANAYAEAMDSAAASMENMQAMAQKFSLPAGDFVSTAKMIGAALVSRGVEDSHLTKSSELTRGYLKAAPVLGIDTSQAQGELMDILGGNLHMNSRLAQRLVNDTPEMRMYRTGGAGAGSRHGRAGGAWAALDETKRLEVLTKALTKFGNNAQVVKANAESLTNQMKQLGDNLIGIFSVLKPIGDALMQPLQNMLIEANRWIKNDGKQLAKIFGGFIKSFVSDPREAFATVQQFRHLTKDVHKSGEVMAFEGMYHFITWIARAFGGFQLEGGLFISVMVALWSSLKKVFYFLEWAGISVVDVIGGALSYALLDIIAPLTLVSTIFQGISKGMAYVEADMANWAKDNAVEVAEKTSDFALAMKKLLSPLQLVINGIADFIEVLFGHTLMFDAALSAAGMFTAVLSMVGDKFVWLQAIMVGFATMGISYVHDLLTGAWGGDIRERAMGFGRSAYDDVINKYKKENDGEKPQDKATKSVTNIGTITIQNQFKEQMQPDRIAFALKEQLLKTTRNKTQANYNSLSGRAAKG